MDLIECKNCDGRGNYLTWCEEDGTVCHECYQCKGFGYTSYRVSNKIELSVPIEERKAIAIKAALDAVERAIYGQTVSIYRHVRSSSTGRED